MRKTLILFMVGISISAYTPVKAQNSNTFKDFKFSPLFDRVGPYFIYNSVKGYDSDGNNLSYKALYYTKDSTAIIANGEFVIDKVLFRAPFIIKHYNQPIRTQEFSFEIDTVNHICTIYISKKNFHESYCAGERVLKENSNIRLIGNASFSINKSFIKTNEILIIMKEIDNEQDIYYYKNKLEEEFFKK